MDEHARQVNVALGAARKCTIKDPDMVLAVETLVRVKGRLDAKRLGRPGGHIAPRVLMLQSDLDTKDRLIESLRGQIAMLEVQITTLQGLVAELSVIDEPEVTPDTEESEVEEPEEDLTITLSDLEECTRSDLMELAENEGLDIKSRSTKSEAFAALKKHFGF